MRLEKVYSACDWCHEHESETLLIVPPEIEAQWWLWSRIHPDLELLALFNAEEVDIGWSITRMWLPKQRVTQVECEILEASNGANGMIHSHHSMAAKMSSQDKRDLIPAYQFSVVTNHSGEVEAYERITLPCGGVGFREVEVMLSGHDVAAADVDAACYELPKVKQQQLVIVPSNGNGHRQRISEEDDGDFPNYNDIYGTARNWPLYETDASGRRKWFE